MTRLLPSDLQHLMDHGYTVVPNFVCGSVVQDLRTDMKQRQFRQATIGNVENSPFNDVRRSSTCVLHHRDTKIVNTLFDILDGLRADLNLSFVSTGKYTANIGPLDDSLQEVMYTYYPPGGFYQRHMDADVESVSNWRKYSFLLYLQQDWKIQDGGQLRIHRDGGKQQAPVAALPNFLDVEPKGGTLVIFCSDKIPHEVLRTAVERYVVVGWFLGDNRQDTIDESTTNPNNKGANSLMLASNDKMNPQVLEALRQVRNAVPGMARKLEPVLSAQTAEHQSGLLLMDDFAGFSLKETPKEAIRHDDTDPTYWKSVAAFDDGGSIQTLSLGGQRLRKVEVSVLSQPVFCQLITLDLGNTDIPVSGLIAWFNRQQPGRLRQVHLGGNALACAGLEQFLQGADKRILAKLEVLDLRYNDIGPSGAAALGQLLRNPDTAWEKLYLEGNCLGDEGVSALSKTGPLLELYLGQNKIGPHGAAALARDLAAGRLRKLYLEGNSVGPTGAISLRSALELQGDSLLLEKLYCDNNNIGKEESIKLGKALRSHTTIGDAAFFGD